MRTDLTDVVVVLDRSGSMRSCRDDAEGGLNTFIDEQRTHPGETRVTLVQFDTEYEFVHKGVPIQNVSRFRLVPRGMTALLDAVGRAIVETGERLASLSEAERPGLVVFVIVTDGRENASKEYTRTQIKEMIEHQQNVYKWQFTYLGANQDAFAEAGGLGIKADAIANWKMRKSKDAFHAASANVARMRKAAAAGETVFSAFTPGEREAMDKDD